MHEPDLGANRPFCITFGPYISAGIIPLGHTHEGIIYCWVFPRPIYILKLLSGSSRALLKNISDVPRVHFSGQKSELFPHHTYSSLPHSTTSAHCGGFCEMLSSPTIQLFHKHKITVLSRGTQQAY